MQVAEIRTLNTLDSVAETVSMPAIWRMRDRREFDLRVMCGLLSKHSSCGFGVSVLLLALLIIAMSNHSDAQIPTVERWTTKDGLPAGVYTVTQTQDGSIWVGTLNGLARFDGAEFTVYRPENLPQLGSVVIEAIDAGPDSQIYIGTDSGLTILRDGHALQLHEEGVAKSSQVTMVLAIGVDEAWFGTAEGSLFHYSHGSVERIGSGFLPHEPIYGLARGPDQTLWIATGGGLFFLRNNRIQHYKPDIPLPVLSLFDLAMSRDGSLFVASDAGLFQIQGNHWKRFRKKEGLPKDPVTILRIDTNDVLWIGTQGGLARLQNGVIRPVNSVSCAINSLLIDKEKSLWTSCSDAKGLIRITFPQIRFLKALGGPGSKPILSVAQEHDGTVWMASHQGLFRKKDEASSQYAQQKGLPGNEVNSVSLSASGKLLVATFYGLASLDHGRIQQLEPKIPGVTDDYSNVVEDRRGTLWAVALDGLHRRNPNQPGFELVSGLRNDISSLVESRDGTVWVSTYAQGLFRFTGETRTNFTTKCGLGSNTIFDTVEDQSGTAWVWTAGGLGRIRKEHCRNLDEASGFPRAMPGELLLDSHGLLWIITQKGIAVVDPSEANQVIDHGGSLQNTRYLGPDDGFSDALSDSPPFRPLQMHPSGDVWIPTFAGIAVVSPEVLNEPHSKLRPHITTFVTDAGPRELSAQVKLQPNDIHLQFTYTVPYSHRVANREYRYRLKGFDLEWRDGGKTKDAVYTSLPPGRYGFEVSSRLPFESWSEPSVPVDVVVLPHFYQTWWWYAALVSLLCCILVLTHRLRLRVLRKQYDVILAARLKERLHLARELHDTLSQGMITVHMKIQLADALLRSEPDAASNQLKSAVGIIRQSTIETRKSIAALRHDRQERVGLDEYLKRLIATFREHSCIALETAIDRELPRMNEEVSHEIARVIEEALANVRLHSEAQLVLLSVKICDDNLRVEIRDNGKGFDLAVQRRDHKKEFGLVGMKERAQRIHAEFEAFSDVGRGTQIVLKVALQALLQ